MPLVGTQLDTLPGLDDWPVPWPGGNAIPMQTRAWTRARVEAVPATSDLRVFAVMDGSRVAALAPLLRIGDWLRELPALHEPSDLIWSSPESLLELARMLARQPLPLVLERVPLDSPTIAALRKAYAGRGVVEISQAMPTPYIELEPHWRDMGSWFNAGRRSDFRRMERRARALGPLEYEIHAPDTATKLEALLEEAYSVESRSWKESASTSLTADHWQGRFFRTFTREALPMGILRIAFLRIGATTVAMQIALEWRRRLWLLKISHDVAFSAVSPGQLLIRHTLAESVKRDLEGYEFMGVMADWTEQWTRQVHHYARVRAIPFSTAATKLLLKKGARSILRQVSRLLS